MSSSAKSRAESPIDFPTTSNSELTTATTFTEIAHAEKHAQKEAEDDLLLANNYFERIGCHQRIHEYAVLQHLKSPTKNSLRLVVESFDNLYHSEIQVSPPLCTEGHTYDAKGAIARGRALAFSEGTPERDRGAYYTDGEAAERYHSEAVGALAAKTAWADDITNKILLTAEGRRYDVLKDHHPANTTASGLSLEEAKLALEHVKNLAQRLLPRARVPICGDTERD
ncbi:hypothetical protein C8F04DRAFT_1284629 [Mycena alexandri]|uniref:Uncharacterized protein n=1 Tax=Mycena alexandri TaxID=1745969 RepID=A0AAD6WKP9_9AGAR|nr:hypothetical protein C8F04DRAFT_1284629 [Mycena alexandri]